MIDKTNGITTLLRKLDALAPDHALDVRSYKRDRSVVFVRTSHDAWLVLEEGFETNRFEDVPTDRMRRLIKTLFKREFPRSHKMRVYDLGVWDEPAWRATARKKL